MERWPGAASGGALPIRLRYPGFVEVVGLAASPKPSSPQGLDMTRLVLHGWRPGLRKIAVTKLLREAEDLGLSPAKNKVDRLLAGHEVAVDVPDAQVTSLAAALGLLGVLVHVPRPAQAAPLNRRARTLPDKIRHPKRILVLGSGQTD